MSLLNSCRLQTKCKKTNYKFTNFARIIGSPYKLYNYELYCHDLAHIIDSTVTVFSFHATTLAHKDEEINVKTETLT